MCGIVYAQSFDGSPVNNAIMQQFDKQRNRGTQGFGIFDGQFGNMVHAAHEDKILKWLVKYDSNLLLMHHRFPTSTINVKRAAHPFSTKKYFGKTQYVLVHNGSIRNAEELFCDHQELGINYHSLLQDLTFNDSEALLWDFALYMEGKQKELTASGGIAFICLKLVKGKLTHMYFARNTNPLMLKRDQAGVSLSSEGEGEMIDADTLYTWNYKLRRLTTRKLDVPGYVYTAQNSGFKSNYAGNYTPGSYAAGRYDEVGDPNCDDCNDWNYACGRHYWPNTAETERRGGRIKNVLERQFGHLFNDDLIPRHKNVIEYEHDPKTQMMLPVGIRGVPSSNFSNALNEAEQRRAAEDSLINKTEPITDEEVTQEYMAYLASVQGHFEQAYWSLECDYEQANDSPETKKNIRHRRLIELVMERIDTDPEYVNEQSVSNIWEAIWKQK